MDVSSTLRATPRHFLVTGAAGFIGSRLVEELLHLGQTVVGFDNFATGHRENVADVLENVGPAGASRFRLIEGDVRDPEACRAAMRGIDVVLHEAALPSVPRSMADPLGAHSVNVDGFMNVLLAAGEAKVSRVVYASSSSVYGDAESDVKSEDEIGRPLSPYAATKRIDEIYADTLQRTHGISSVGLRYFNVFGPRQDPAGAYAAVIPRWIEKLLRGEQCVVYGDGSASRDFCFVDDVVQANLLAACTPDAVLAERVFNVACGARTTLLELFALIRSGVESYEPSAGGASPRLEDARPGDVPHSLASIDRARSILGYAPRNDVRQGLRKTITWYAERGLRASPASRPRPTALPREHTGAP